MFLFIPPAAVPTDGPPATAQWLPALLLSVGIIILLLLWTISLRGRAARKHEEYQTPREHIERIKAGHRSRDAEQTQAAEIVSSLTELAARLENKAERLEQLLEQADARIARLNQAVSQRAPDAEKRPPSIAPKLERESPPAPVEPSDPLIRAVYELDEAGHSPVEIAQRLEEQVGKVELILALRRQ